MANQYFNILLADDDPDDCMLFKEALDELAVPVVLTAVNNGEDLMNVLENKSMEAFPDVLFLDLNMPRKSGLECLSDLKQNEMFGQIPIIIYSTSSSPEVMDLLYDKGVQYYIRKPADFADLKSVIHRALCLCKENKMRQPPKESFMIRP